MTTTRQVRGPAKKKVKTAHILVSSDVARMAVLLAKFGGVSVAELVDPYLREPLRKRVDRLPDEFRQMSG